jgi:hypothetical protein
VVACALHDLLASAPVRARATPRQAMP